MIRDGCINLGPTEGLEEAWGGRGVPRTRVRVLDHGVWAALRTSNQSQLRRRRELGEGDEHDFYVTKGAILSIYLLMSRTVRPFPPLALTARIFACRSPLCGCSDLPMTEIL